MAANDDPFTTFNFDVVLTLATPIPGVGQPVCQGSFSECDGLSLEMEPKSVLQGGVNDTVTHLVMPIRPGQLTLRRGMTSSADLWTWMAALATPGKPLTADGQITMLDGSGAVQARFLLSGCLPVRLRGPALNAQTGLVAVEELGLAVGHLALAGATGAGGGLSIGASISGGFSAGVSGSASASAQISGGLGLSGQLGGTLSASASASAGASASASAGASFGGGG